MNAAHQRHQSRPGIALHPAGYRPTAPETAPNNIGIILDPPCPAIASLVRPLAPSNPAGLPFLCHARRSAGGQLESSHSS